MRRVFVLWIAAWLLTLGAAVWQRMSGPTYPVRIQARFEGAEVRAKLLRSSSINGPLRVEVTTDDPAVTGAVSWRRHPTDDPWTETPLARHGFRLTAELPPQPMAGKLAYRVTVRRPNPAGGPDLELPLTRGGGPVIARFKGDVPLELLLAHVVVVFASMLYSARAGLEAIAGGPRLSRYVGTVTGLFAFGGLILGPLVQKAAFDAYWTGWPFGGDLTDNKVAVAVLFWVVAWLVGRGARPTRAARACAVAAALVMLVIFSVPHSMWGSQHDFATGTTTTGAPARHP